MGVEEEKKKKIVRLIKTSAKKDEQVKPKTGTATALGHGNIQIGGNAGTTIVYNGPVFVGTEPPTAQEKTKTGISNHQAAQLHKLKDEIVSLETEPDKVEAAKNVWRSLNHKMQVETMRDIPAESSRMQGIIWELGLNASRPRANRIGSLNSGPKSSRNLLQKHLNLRWLATSPHSGRANRLRR